MNASWSDGIAADGAGGPALSARAIKPAAVWTKMCRTSSHWVGAAVHVSCTERRSKASVSLGNGLTLSSSGLSARTGERV